MTNCQKFIQLSAVAPTDAMFGRALFSWALGGRHGIQLVNDVLNNCLIRTNFSLDPS